MECEVEGGWEDTTIGHVSDVARAPRFKQFQEVNQAVRKSANQEVRHQQIRQSGNQLIGQAGD